MGEMSLGAGALAPVSVTADPIVRAVWVLAPDGTFSRVVSSGPHGYDGLLPIVYPTPRL